MTCCQADPGVIYRHSYQTASLFHDCLDLMRRIKQRGKRRARWFTTPEQCLKSVKCQVLFKRTSATQSCSKRANVNLPTNPYVSSNSNCLMGRCFVLGSLLPPPWTRGKKQLTVLWLFGSIHSQYLLEIFKTRIPSQFKTPLKAKCQHFRRRRFIKRSLKKK